MFVASFRSVAKCWGSGSSSGDRVNWQQIELNLCNKETIKICDCIFTRNVDTFDFQSVIYQFLESLLKSMARSTWGRSETKTKCKFLARLCASSNCMISGKNMYIVDIFAQFEWN